MHKPRVRLVEAIPFEQEGEVFILVRDPEQVCERQLVVPPATLVVMSLMDGTRTLDDIQAEITQHTQAIVPKDDIRTLVDQLDQLYLLDNERSNLRQEEIERDYLSQPVRPAAHAGVSYPDDPDELISVFDAYSATPRGGVSLDLTAVAPVDDAAESGRRNGHSATPRAPRGLILPHIDFRCGGPAMCRTLEALRVAEPPQCYVILGVAHHPTRNLYAISAKDFDTPLGPARADRQAIDLLRSHYGAERLDGELAHKHEHSVEFAAVLLKYLHRDDHDFTIVPVLCGSIEEAADEEGAWPPSEVEQFADALRAMTERLEKRVCVIASVDLSHVGKKFGDERGVDDLRAGLIQAADLRMLDSVKLRDPEAWFNHFREDDNARNVDAVTAVYTQLKVLGDGDTHLTSYDQYREPETDSLVSFASMVLY